MTTGVTVHGRALARNGAVTLDNDTFTSPTCDLTTPVVTTPTSLSCRHPDHHARRRHRTRAAALLPGGAVPPGGTLPPGGTTPPGGSLPRTGSQAETTLLLAAIALTLGLTATVVGPNART